ncbi:unnamed protein product [Caretta caretta]
MRSQLCTISSFCFISPTVVTYNSVCSSASDAYNSKRTNHKVVSYMNNSYRNIRFFLSTQDPHTCLVFGGDFNAILDVQDHTGREKYQAAVDVLRRIVDQHSLVDNTTPIVPAHSNSIRLAPFSWVSAVMALLTPEQQGRAYWHFNSSLLEDAGFAVSFWEFWLTWWRQKHAFALMQRWGRYVPGSSAMTTPGGQSAAIEKLEQEVLELELAAHPGDPSFCRECQENHDKLQALNPSTPSSPGHFLSILQPAPSGNGSQLLLLTCFLVPLFFSRHRTCLLEEDSNPLTDLVEMQGRARAFYPSLFTLELTNDNSCRVLWDELPIVVMGGQICLEQPLTS